MNARLKSLIHFLDDGIWRIREEEVPHLQWKGYTCLKIIYLSINQFINDRIVVRASALTYSTLLSIIPILALLFAIARGFGFDTLIESQFRSGVTGAQAELVISWINSYLEQCWELINLSETTRKHCMILENCCYDWFEMNTLNMAQQGVFGEVLRAQGAYIHNLDDFWPYTTSPPLHV